MDYKTKFDEKSFNLAEKEILKEVMHHSKSIIETFKFRMISGLNMKQAEVNKTLKGLAKFREKNWNKRLSRNKAYKKYLSLY